jgi:hypothetical protein
MISATSGGLVIAVPGNVLWDKHIVELRIRRTQNPEEIEIPLEKGGLGDFVLRKPHTVHYPLTHPFSMTKSP